MLTQRQAEVGCIPFPILYLYTQVLLGFFIAGYSELLSVYKYFSIYLLMCYVIRGEISLRKLCGPRWDTIVNDLKSF